MVPLYPEDAKGAWPYRASFDEWGALYTKNRFLQSSALKDDHTLEVVARNVASTDPVTVELWVSGEKSARQSVQATPSSGEVKATFAARFLQRGNAVVLPVGKVLKVILRDGSVSYAWSLALDIGDLLVDEPTSKENAKLSPFNTGTTSGALRPSGPATPRSWVVAASSSGFPTCPWGSTSTPSTTPSSR